MFEGFAHVWTPVTTADALGDRPLAVTVAGEKLALFRDGRGGVGALVDRCPHRGVALSLGTVTPAGCLACPFHGWEFDAAGQNVHVPFTPDAKREQLGAVAVPARELGGLLWVYTAPGATAPTEPSPPVSLTRTDLGHTYTVAEWATHWTRAMENMLDSPHVPFVHRATIGRDQRKRMTRDSRMTMRWEATDFGGHIGMTLDDQPEVMLLEFHKPNLMLLKIPIPGRLFRMHAICVPVGPRATRMIVVGARDFATSSLLNPFFKKSNDKILFEDQAVLESSEPPEVPPAGDERSVASDRPTLQFRKYHFDVLKPSAA
jgi:phenylpropionate dioxygenase-like ring-hydroxylating dioxygenase large terminal subunit